MRNLKRLLTMVMAIAMMMSLMVVGAGAAFSDQDKIENTDAVNMNVALGIIKGRDTGNFDPTGNVTRAEMAKMICIVLNGGNEPTLGAKATATFNDTKGHWAEAYIEYCASLGIVAGMGDGTFAPNANVTGTQAAKMLLVALGYDAAFEGFNGASWSVKINVAANQKVLYDELTIDPNAALNRDDAAQMVWNALNANEVKYTYSLTTVNGQLMNVQNREDKTTDLLASKFKTNGDFTGTMVAYKWNTTDKKFDYTISYNTTDKAGKAIVDTTTFQSATDYTALFAMKVNVVYKDNTSKTVYGMYGDDSKVLYTGVASDIENYDSTYIKIDGNKYKTEGTADVNAITAYPENNYYYDTVKDVDGNAATIGVQSNTLDKVSANYTVKVIDQDDDNKVDCVVYLPFEVAKVTYVGSKNITVTANSIDTSFSFDDDYIYTGVAKDDYVMITGEQNTAKDGNQVAKMSAVTGKVTAIKSNKVQVNNTWYEVDGSKMKNTNSFTLNDEYTLYAIGSYVYYADEGDNASAKDIAFVADTENGSINGDRAKLYFTDGTSAIVSLDDIYQADGKTVIASKDLATIENQLVSFEKSGTDYDLTLIGDANDCGYDGYVAATGDADGDNAAKITAATSTKAGKFEFTVAGAPATTTTYAIDNSATIFVLEKDGDVKVVSGATANSYKSPVAALDTAATVVSSLLYDTTNGVKTAKVGMILADTASLPNAKGASDNYAVVMGAPYSVKIDDDTYAAYDIWNGTKTVTVYEDSKSVDTTAAEEGAIIQYTDLGDNKIDDVKIVTTLSGTKGYFAVDGYNGNDLNLVAADGSGLKTATTAKSGEYIIDTNSGKGYTITKDTVILYVDTEKDEGYASGAVQLAKEEISGGNYFYKTNVFVYDEATTDGELDLLVVDVSNQFDNAVIK